MTAMNPLNPPGEPTSRAVQNAFETFARELNLDRVERRDASEKLDEVTQRLRDEGIITDAFLQGSLARRTMVSPLRDIDEVVILGPEHAHLRGIEGGARGAADLIGGALRRQYPGATHDVSRHSLKVDFGEDTFSFDVVPAFEVLDGSDDVEIMDLTHGLWSRSNPRELIRVVAERDRLCGGAFVHQVRFVKHWLRQALGDDFPGLHAEAIAYACIDELLGHAEAVERVFMEGARLLGPLGGYWDPTGRDRLDERLDAGIRANARAAFEGAANSVNEAMEHVARGRDEAALAIFADVFGPLFPRPVAQEGPRRLTPGAATAAALRSVEPPGPTPRAWRSS